MKKIFCDGCEKDITKDPMEYQVSINAVVNSAQRSLYVGTVGVQASTSKPLNSNFDLCRGCADSLLRHANPTAWPRMMEATK